MMKGPVSEATRRGNDERNERTDMEGIQVVAWGGTETLY